MNNVAIKKSDLLPFFHLVQELYNTALAKTYGKEYASGSFSGIICEPVNVRNYFDGSYQTMVSYMVDEEKISDSEISEIKRIIEDKAK